MMSDVMPSGLTFLFIPILSPGGMVARARGHVKKNVMAWACKGGITWRRIHPGLLLEGGNAKQEICYAGGIAGVLGGRGVGLRDLHSIFSPMDLPSFGHNASG
jgi:hypothetical protein